jgi:hypothetical protein
MKILERSGQANVRQISLELMRLGGKKYPANEGRVSNYLRQLKAMGYVDYYRRNTKHKYRLRLPTHEGIWIFKRPWIEEGDLVGRSL